NDPELVWAIAPRAATKYAVRTFGPDARRAICGPLEAVSETVLCPLPHVAVHLINAPGVWIESIDGNGFSPKITSRSVLVRKAAVVIGLGWRDRWSPPELGRRPRAGDILPFRFAEQTIRFAGLHREPIDVSLGIMP